MSVILPSLQSVDLASNSALSHYLTASRTVCPFIEASAKAGCLYSCEVTPDCQTSHDIHPRFFEQVVPLVERFRDQRRELPDQHQRLLICHVVVMHVPAHLDADAVRLLNWPNWLNLLLKQLYTPKEIVFGFVRKNAIEKSLFGKVVPVSPFHAIIIRSRVVGSDKRFFAGNQALLQAMMQAEDDGGDAHAAVPGHAVDIQDAQAMREVGYFERVRQWGQKNLAGR